MNLIDVSHSSLTLRSPVAPWLTAPEPELPLRRLVLVTDAWKPQTNGVVNTLVRLVNHLESQGTEVLVIAPDAHRTLPLPSYPEIRVACDPWRAIPRIRAFEPDAIHVATEGPLGFWTVGWLRRARPALHHQLPHPLRRVPERARCPVPLEWGYQLVRWFHERAEHTLVSSQSLLRRAAGAGGWRGAWCTGRAASTPRCFTPTAGAATSTSCRARSGSTSAASRSRRRWRTSSSCRCRAPRSWSATGRRAPTSSARFPDVVWRGYRFGDDLAAHFASADCFVFPSRTETFGNVLLEAMASGLPVASVPAPGPIDLVEEGVNGAIDDQLMRACLRALRCSRERTRASILGADAARGPRGLPRAPGAGRVRARAERFAAEPQRRRRRCRRGAAAAL